MDLGVVGADRLHTPKRSHTVSTVIHPPFLPSSSHIQIQIRLPVYNLRVNGTKVLLLLRVAIGPKPNPSINISGTDAVALQNKSIVEVRIDAESQHALLDNSERYPGAS